MDAKELSDKAESEGDTRGAVVALCEVREFLVSLNGLRTKAEGGGSGGITVTVYCIGETVAPPKGRLELDRSMAKTCD